MGMGDWRFFICPKGMVGTHELPENWGLIEVNGNGKVRIKYNPFGKGNIYSTWDRHKKNKDAEIAMMYSALRRIEIRNLMDVIYTPVGTKEVEVRNE